MSDPFEPLHILEVHKGWLAVDKPCGMSVHNDPGRDLISLLSDRIATDSRLAAGLGISSFTEAHAVHRLDRETSGVILLCTDKGILKDLSELFAAGKIKKKYLALVHGTFDRLAKTPEYHLWEYPLSKTDGGRNDPTGKGRRVNCITRYRVIGQSDHYSLLDIELLTGRKHQIRRHAKLSGHPVTGDRRYGSKKSIRYLMETLSYQRLGLHCSQLGFIPPGQSEHLCIASKNPLTDIFQLLAQDGFVRHNPGLRYDSE